MMISMKKRNNDKQEATTNTGNIEMQLPPPYSGKQGNNLISKMNRLNS